MELDVRKTVSGCTAEEVESIIMEEIEELRKKNPSCQRMLQVAEKEPSITERPQLAHIFRERPDELKKLVSYCLEPEKLGCRNSSYPYLARNILRAEPPILLLSLIDPPTVDGRCLFEFLKSNPNETARGYFFDLLNIFSNNYQHKIRNFLDYDKISLDMCLNHSYYPEVFSSLFNMIIYSTENAGAFESRLLERLLSCITDKRQPIMITQNILSALTEINQNIGRIHPTVCNFMISALNTEYVDQIINLISDNFHEHEEQCQSLLQILAIITRIYDYMKNSNNKQNANRNIDPLQKAVAKIIQSMAKIQLILKQDFPKEINFSNGEIVTVVGLMKYYALELVEKLLELPMEFVLANFDINKGGLLQDLQNYITKNPWNNMVHRLVEKIVISVIDTFESSATIEQNYIGKQGFLGFLIQTFKNHDYMFLSSGKLSTYGYIHYLYNIAKAICNQLQKSTSVNLRTVMQKFSPWEEFIINDLQKYEITLEENLGGEPMNSVNIKKQKQQDSIRKIVVDLSQKEISITAEQNQDANDHFVEIILYSQGFKKGRSAVRKNSYSVDSPIRYHRGDDQSDRKSVQFLSHQPSPIKQKQKSSTPRGTPIMSPACDRLAGLEFGLYPTSSTFTEPKKQDSMHKSQLLEKPQKSPEKELARNQSRSFSAERKAKQA